MRKRIGQLLYITNQQQSTLVMYTDGEEDVMMVPLAKAMKQLCLQHGSSLEGRAESFRYLTKSIQKPCILLDEKEEVLLFPLLGLASLDNYFINYNKVVTCKGVGNHECEILFSDGTKLVIPFDVRVIRNQMKRCELYLEKLLEH